MPGFTFDVAYAEIFGVLPVNGAQHGASVDASGTPYPAVNDGTYAGHSHLVSAGVTVRFDELLLRSKPAEPP